MRLSGSTDVSYFVHVRGYRTGMSNHNQSKGFLGLTPCRTGQGELLTERGLSPKLPRFGEDLVCKGKWKADDPEIGHG